jgi:hypothetical protein
MFERLSVQELVFLSLIAAGLFVTNMVTAAAVVAVTAIPLSSALVTALAFGIFAVLAVSVVPKVGALTLIILINTILTFPTSLGGAPGFWPKIPIDTFAAFVGDVFIYLMNYKKWSFFVGFYIISAIDTVVFVRALVWFGLPGVEKTQSLMYVLILAYWVLGTIGIFVGFLIYERIKNVRMIRFIRGV